MSRHGHRSQETERLDTTVEFEIPRTRTGPIGGTRAESARSGRTTRGGQPPRARSWWPPLADELFQIMHDDGNAPGRLRIAERTAALGLAGALLAELACTERIALCRDTIAVVDLSVPSDVAAHMILSEIAGEAQEHPVSTWVHYLADTAYERVARRMVHLGRVREQVRRRWLHRTTMVAPVPGGGTPLHSEDIKVLKHTKANHFKARKTTSTS